MDKAKEKAHSIIKKAKLIIKNNPNLIICFLLISFFLIKKQKLIAINK